MSQLLFVWLGSNRAKKQGVSAPGVLLDRAARAGLPVPAGAILLHNLYRLALAEGIAAVQDGRVTVPTPDRLHDWLYTAVRFPKIQALVAARPVLLAEKEAAEKHNSSLTPDSFVDFTNPMQLADSLARAWSSALNGSSDGWRDVLVMAMVPAEVTGVALSQQAGAEDLVYFSPATAVPDAAVTTGSLSLPRPRWWWQSTAGIPPFAQRLQRLLRGLRRTFGPGNWRVEWIDDGRICWLWQIQTEP